jgi:hypothetical protein
MKFADVCGMIPIIFSPLDCFRRGACRQFNVTRTKAYCMMSLQQKHCQSQVASNQPFLQAYCSLILRSVESHRDRFYIIRHSGQGPVSFCDRFPLSKVLQFAPCLLLDSILNGRWQVWWRRDEINAIGNRSFLTLMRQPFGRLWLTAVTLRRNWNCTLSSCIAQYVVWKSWMVLICQCFSTAGLRPDTGPWHQLYRAARGCPGCCHFSFLSIFY